MKKAPLAGLRWQLVLLILALLAGWAFWLEPDSLQLTEHALGLQRWPAAQNGLRIAVITDLHAGTPFIDHAKVARIVTQTNAAQPDLILLPGDFVIQGVVGGTPIAPEHIALWLSALRAPLGVYVVLGNHDQWRGAARMRSAFETVGIPVLDEQVRHLVQGRFDIWLMGVADFSTDNPQPKRLMKRIEGDAPIIAFTHSPDAMSLIDARVNLLIAGHTYGGHTHGGQVRLPFYGAVTTSSEYGKRYEIGHIVEQTDLFVCPGIGTSILPVRFLDPPEICLLNLNANDARTPP